MADIENKINELLSSPDSLAQILTMAKTLMGGGSQSTPAPDSEPASVPVSAVDSEPKPQSEATPSTEQSAGKLEALDSIDPQMIRMAMGLMTEYRSADDRRLHLLNALRPYMKGKDAGHIDKAIQIMRLSKVAKRAFFSDMGGDLHV